MEKQFVKLTSGFLSMNRLLLFLLIASPLTLRITSLPENDYRALNLLLACTGGICLSGWIFAIGHKANRKLISQGMNANYFKLFNLAFIAVVISFILIISFGTEVNSTINNIKIHYVTPAYLFFIFGVGFFVALVIAAKTLVSVELNKDARVGEYFSTLLLMLFAILGLWFIQPRVQNI